MAAYLKYSFTSDVSDVEGRGGRVTDGREGAVTSSWREGSMTAIEAEVGVDAGTNAT
jgi:hypothetical protein